MTLYDKEYQAKELAGWLFIDTTEESVETHKKYADELATLSDEIIDAIDNKIGECAVYKKELFQLSQQKQFGGQWFVDILKKVRVRKGLVG